ncbi:MAG: IS66 family insertion sequence element accessory protein TnpB [Oceanospirillaceae bacterium]|nr:IS66 family insertion sequence element accessory protein TnpB [Oceanospirillaceae bacterium]
MKSLSEFQQIYLHRDFVDFRKSINGLSLIVKQEMEMSPYGAGPRPLLKELSSCRS